jgi:pimeloyl-ACP methyl ester carboxylesterase
MWQNVIGPLSEKYRVIVPDFPGFGESPPPPAPFTTDDYVHFINKLMDALDIEKGTFAGISYGGEICALLSSRAPQRVERLVLIAATGFNRPAWIAVNDIRWSVASFLAKHILLRSRTFLSLNGARSFRDVKNRPAGFVENFRRELLPEGKRDVFLQTVRNISGETGMGRVATHYIPTKIVWGADVLVSLADATEYQQAIPALTLFRTDTPCRSKSRRN